MFGMICSDCLYWQRITTAVEEDIIEPQGECHRYPPVLTLVADDAECETDLPWYFPVTLGDQWCGEYRSRAEHQAAEDMCPPDFG